MKKVIFALTMALLMSGSIAAGNLKISKASDAEILGLAPGLYIESADGCVQMVFDKGVADLRNDIDDAQMESLQRHVYKGVTSKNVATGSFILVRDTRKKSIVETMKKYNPFIRTMSPSDMIMVPLEVVGRARVFDGFRLKDLIRNREQGAAFEWEQISDNVFRIILPEETPAGEYAFSFRISRIAEYRFSAVYSFSVAE